MALVLLDQLVLVAVLADTLKGIRQQASVGYGAGKAFRELDAAVHLGEQLSGCIGILLRQR